MHETLRLSTRRRNRPKVSALGRVRVAGLSLDRLVRVQPEEPSFALHFFVRVGLPGLSLVQSAARLSARREHVRVQPPRRMRPSVASRSDSVPTCYYRPEIT
jgi:hypothetical protein